MSCFTLGKMKGLTNSQLIKYSHAVSIFKAVEAYNARILSLRKAGDEAQTYYEFTDANERNDYNLGRFLLAQNNPAFLTYVPVQKI